MNSTIENLISQYQQEDDYTRVPLTPEMLNQVVNSLGVVIPDQYLCYLNEYSQGGIAGVEVLGIGLDGSIVFLEETLEYRKEGLPHNLVVIENCDEWLYCIDCKTGEVVSWSFGGLEKKEFDCFDDFLLSEYLEAIENL